MLAFLFFYVAVIFAFFTVVAALADYCVWRTEQRERYARRERLRRQRAYLDSLEPQRWVAR